LLATDGASALTFCTVGDAPRTGGRELIENNLVRLDHLRKPFDSAYTRVLSKPKIAGSRVASVPVLTFVSPRSRHFTNVRTKGTLANTKL
jgi:hypothetical protein